MATTMKPKLSTEKHEGKKGTKATGIHHSHNMLKHLNVKVVTSRP